MRHLFVIQCCKYEPALALGTLLKNISPIRNSVNDWEVFYAYDKRCADAWRFDELPNSHGFQIGYCTTDQGLFHILLWRYLSEHSDFDYYHLISESDLPFKSIYRIDQCIKDIDAYGFYHTQCGMNKAIAWYGLSRKVVEFIHDTSRSISQELIDIWFEYIDKNISSGGVDEYMVGYLLNLISSQFNYINDVHRFVFWRESKTTADNGIPFDQIGFRPTNAFSPVTLGIKPMTVEAFNTWDTFFGRKFEFNSESYNYFYTQIQNEQRI